MKRLLLTILILLSSSAFADWSPVGFDKKTKEPVIAIDYAKSFNSNGILYVWWKDYSYGNLTVVARPANHPMTIYRTQINCRNQMIRNDYVQSVEVKYFSDPNPETYSPAVDTSRTEWYVPSPGDTHEFIVNLVCKK